jgi:hypothetical protein
MIISEFIAIHGQPPYDLNFWPGGVDLSRWGNECKRGTAVASGTAGVVRKISTGRKERGSASDGYDRQQARNG